MIVVLLSVFCTLILALPALLVWRTPTIEELMLLGSDRLARNVGPLLHDPRIEGCRSIRRAAVYLFCSSCGQPSWGWYCLASAPIFGSGSVVR